MSWYLNFGHVYYYSSYNATTGTPDFPASFKSGLSSGSSTLRRHPSAARVKIQGLTTDGDPARHFRGSGGEVPKRSSHSFELAQNNQKNIISSFRHLSHHWEQLIVYLFTLVRFFQGTPSDGVWW